MRVVELFGHCVCFDAQAISSGKARWSVKVHNGRKTTVGVCLTSVDKGGYVNKTTRGWGYYQSNGRKGHAGPAKEEYGAPFKQAGDVIDVELDASAGTLRFFKNGVDQGIAYDDLPKGGQFVGAVSLYDAGDSVTLLRAASPAAPAPAPAAPAPAAGAGNSFHSSDAWRACASFGITGTPPPSRHAGIRKNKV